AGLFNGIGDRAHAARYLAAGALAIWLLTMFLFLRATEASRAEANTYRLGSPTLHAVVSAGMATVATITVFVLITTTSLSVDVDGGILQLDEAGLKAVNGLCPAQRGNLLPGGIEVPSLKEDFVV